MCRTAVFLRPWLSYRRRIDPGTAKLCTAERGRRSEDSSSEGAVIARLVAGIVRELVPLRGTPGEQYSREIRQDRHRRDRRRARADRRHRLAPSVLFRESGHALDGRRLGCIVGVMTDPVTATPTGAIAEPISRPNGEGRQGEDARHAGGHRQALRRRGRAWRPSPGRRAGDRARRDGEGLPADVVDRIDGDHGEVSASRRHRGADGLRRPRSERRGRASGERSRERWLRPAAKRMSTSAKSRGISTTRSERSSDDATYETPEESLRRAGIVEVAAAGEDAALLADQRRADTTPGGQKMIGQSRASAPSSSFAPNMSRSPKWSPACLFPVRSTR